MLDVSSYQRRETFEFSKEMDGLCVNRDQGS